MCSSKISKIKFCMQILEAYQSQGRFSYIFMPPKELWEAYSNRTVRPSVHPASCPVHISYILRGRNSKFGVLMHLGMTECRIPFSGHCDLDLDL